MESSLLLKLQTLISPPQERPPEPDAFAAVEPLAHYREDPLGFCENILEIPRAMIDWSLMPQYAQHRWDGTPNPLKHAVDAIIQNRNVGIESGTGTSKTFTFAAICYWFAACWKPARVITTAPKKDQLNMHIWKEIRDLFPKFRRHFPTAELNDLRIEIVPGNKGWGITGFVAGVKAEEIDASASRAAGIHSPNMLILFEETPGIHPAIIKAFKFSCTADHNIMVALGNPNHEYDTLHRFCTKTPNIAHIRISGYDHPNVVTGNGHLAPGAITKKALDEMLEEYGPNDPQYQAKARGLCPQQSQSALIRREWCTRAAEMAQEDPERYRELMRGHKARGLDPSHSEAGDPAGRAIGEGAVLLSCEDFPCPDAMVLGLKEAETVKSINDDAMLRYRRRLEEANGDQAKVADAERWLERERQEPGRIGIDSIGYGAATVSAMRLSGFEDVVGLNGGSAPTERSGEVEKFANLRAQMHWQMRRDLKNGSIALPYVERLFDELCSVQFEIRNGVIHIEKKEEIKRRLGRSPNLGDAAVYWNWIRQMGGIHHYCETVHHKESVRDPQAPVKAARDWTDSVRSATGRWG